VVQIVKHVDLSFVRNLHYWEAQFLLIIALLHMTRVFISGAYKKPREIQWLTGVVLLVIIFAFSYTGTVLKGDQEGIDAFGHQIETSDLLGPLHSILNLQFTPGIPAFTRLLALHVTVIPIIAILVVAVHLILIRLNNISVPKITQNNRIVSLVGKKAPFSSHVARLVEYGAAATMIAIILALISPAPLYHRGMEGMEITKPPWYLIWLYPLEDIFGIKAIAGTCIIMFAILVAVPLVDTKEITDPRRRKAMIICMLACSLIAAKYNAILF
jgi:quinol-cytochrome oxidoreductase complex cytochrome b subunit